MSTVAAPLTLADTLPNVRWRSAALVVGAALLTAAAAQIRFSLGFTPVPITGQTFAVLLTGAALGAKRGALGQGLYWILGAVGLPFYTGAEGGWDAATGSTAGYLFGFVVAAYVIGALAERGQDRSLATSVPAMLAGTATIYLFGVSWLAFHLDVPFYAGNGKDAFTYGLVPFIPGDILKLVVAAGLLPLAWKFVSRHKD
jgi:biotin transport system substrate-specific component